MSHPENAIATDKNVLVVLGDTSAGNPDLQNLMQHFCGRVVSSLAATGESLADKRIFACGDLSLLHAQGHHILVIGELSHALEALQGQSFTVIHLGKVPLLVSRAGVYYRRMFDGDDLFHRIKSEHAFQELTEGSKESKALRKGIYLTPVSQELTADGGEALRFRLLRCSSNLTGPTDNFRTTDHLIVDALNDAIRHDFAVDTQLNHVLAQIYENRRHADGSGKESKSKIKAHADKTKDMPTEAVMAFCTFYDMTDMEALKPNPADSYDLLHGKVSALTRLHFKLKPGVQDDHLDKEFTVTLYPNSAFLMPLSTNRLYTHEIRPAAVGIGQMPTRLGYVARTSNQEAVYTDGRTLLQMRDGLIPLQPSTEEAVQKLRHNYYAENTTTDKVEYGEVLFSMNLGDYEKPIL